MKKCEGREIIRKTKLTIFLYYGLATRFAFRYRPVIVIRREIRIM